MVDNVAVLGRPSFTYINSRLFAITLEHLEQEGSRNTFDRVYQQLLLRVPAAQM